MAIGVQGFTVRKRYFNLEQLEVVYKKIADMGYDGPEGGLGGRLMPIEEDAALLKKYGLRVSGASGDITKPDEAMKRADVYGVKLLGMPAIPGNMMHSVEGFKAYAKQMNELAKPYKGTGYRLQYHNHAQEFRNFPEINGRAGMDILIEESDPEVIMFKLDTHWMAAAGCDSAQWIRKVKGRIPVVHFKDYAINSKAEDPGMGSVYKRFAEIGQGNLNWAAIKEACVEAGAEWYIVEQDQTVLDEFECLKISIDYMRSIGIK